MKNTLTIRLALSVAAVALAVSCATEQLKEQEDPGKQLEVEVGALTFGASFLPLGKTSLQQDGSSYKVQWTAGESIVVADTPTNKFSTSCTEFAMSFISMDRLSAEFTGTPHDGAGDLYAITPYSSENYMTTTAGKLRTRIPHAQTGIAGAIPPDLNLAAGKIEEGSVMLHNIGCYISFVVGEDDITSITFRGNEVGADSGINSKLSTYTETVAGVVYADFNEGSPFTLSTYSGGTTGHQFEIVLTPEGGVFEKGERYFILTLPRSFSQGVTFSCTSAGGNFELSSDVEMTLERSKVYPLGTLTRPGFKLARFEDLNAGTAVEGDHAAAAARSSLVLDYRSKTTVTPNSEQVTDNGPVYPRFARMANGKWIMTYHNRPANSCGYDCRYFLSDDLLSWTYGNYMFQRYAIDYPAISGNKRTFSNCIPCTLADGSTIAVASYRSNKQYKDYPEANGIVMRRTTDGVSWSQSPFTAQEIVSGETNWEPWIYQQPSGRIEVYFTDANNTRYFDNDSGTSMIYSDDNGVTWSGKQKVIRHKFDDSHFTDQMISVARIPGSSQLFFASEVWDDDDNGYSVSIGKSKADGTWDALSDSEEGPSDYRWKQIPSAAAPTVMIFPSGELVLSYNSSSAFYGRLATPDYDAVAAAPAKQLLEASGWWGTVHEVGTHKMVAAIFSGASIVMAQYCLNHDIRATARTAVTDGINQEWRKTDEALFLGANSQAQATLRCSQDAENLYFLVEVRDEDLKTADYVQVFLAPYGKASLDADCRRFGSKVAAAATQCYWNGSKWTSGSYGITSARAKEGTLDDNTDTDTGYYAEICVPRSAITITDGKVLLNLLLHDSGHDDELLASNSDLSYWIEVSGL